MMVIGRCSSFVQGNKKPAGRRAVSGLRERRRLDLFGVDQGIEMARLTKATNWVCDHLLTSNALFLFTCMLFAPEFRMWLLSAIWSAMNWPWLQLFKALA
jgi:hypothetical protein